MVFDAPRETVDLRLQHPITGRAEETIEVVTVRRLSYAERQDIRRTRHTRQRRGIATVQAATGLSWNEVREIEQVDADAIGAAIESLDQDFIAFGETLAGG